MIDFLWLTFRLVDSAKELSTDFKKSNWLGTPSIITKVLSAYCTTGKSGID
jgi:hypothetical protein